jgi:hypothetical protein
MEVTKTTLNLPTQLFIQTKVFAINNQVSFTQVIQEALQEKLNQTVAPAKPSLASFLDSLKSERFSSSTNVPIKEQYHNHLKKKYG